MDDNLKLLIFAAVFFAFIMVARKLSGTKPQDPSDLYIAPPSPDPDPPPAERPLTKVGSELGLPDPVIKLLREMPEDERPNIVNYYFDKLDLQAGPADPTDFLDRLVVQSRGEKDIVFSSSMVVTTPATLARLLREEHRDAIYAMQYLIVERFDIATILCGWLKAQGTVADTSDENFDIEPPPDYY